MINPEIFSSTYHKIISYDGGFVFDLLKKNIPHLSDSNWLDRAEFGGLYVNGIPCKDNILLPNPACVEYYEPNYDINHASDFFPTFNKNWIVFEDDFLIVAYKPDGIPTMPSKEQSLYCLRSYLNKYVGHAVHCPSRLDTSTQGLVICSKDNRVHGLLQKQFEHRTIQKEYRLLTASKIDWEEKNVDLPIGKSTLHPVLREVNGKDSKSANTFFKIINSHNNKTQIAAFPKTGRTHQIRVHSSHEGFPIVGDKFYGSGVIGDKLHLVSYGLVLQHPVTDKLTEVNAPKSLLPVWVN